MKPFPFILGVFIFLIGILRTINEEGIFFSLFFTGIAIMSLSMNFANQGVDGE